MSLGSSVYCQECHGLCKSVLYRTNTPMDETVAVLAVAAGLQLAAAVLLLLQCRQAVAVLAVAVGSQLADAVLLLLLLQCRHAAAVLLLLQCPHKVLCQSLQQAPLQGSV